MADADLVYKDDAFESEPGFAFIGSTAFYETVEFGCKVPPTLAGPVRVSISANGFSSNERALDPEGAFVATYGRTIMSFGCSPGEYTTSANVACRKCAAGKVANSDGKSCVACPRRTYQPDEGQITCLDCPYNPDTNSSGTESASW